MSLQSLKEIINNNVVDILSEIGEGTKPFPFKLLKDKEIPDANEEGATKYIVEYQIDTPNIPILVNLVSYSKYKKYGVYLDFQALTSKDGTTDVDDKYKITDEGLSVMFGILTTIKEILKDFLTRYDIEIFSLTYVSANTSKDDSASDSEKRDKALKRHKLYVAYIKKLFPEAVVNESRFPLFKVMVFFRRLVGAEDIK